MGKTDVIPAPKQTDLLSGLDAAAYGTNTDVAAFLAEADVQKGRRLIEDKDSLVGVPLGVTGLTFRTGDRKDSPGYVSVEAVLLREGVDVVFNDGSTGIRRQCAQYLMAKGVVPEGDADKPLVGADGGPLNADVKWAWPRGLRVSSYDHPEYGPSQTYYIA